MDFLRKRFYLGEDLNGSPVPILLENGEFQPTLVFGTDSTQRDLLVRLLIEGYSSSGVPCILLSDGIRFSGIARPSSARKSHDNLLPRGFTTTSINAENLLEKEYRFSVESLGAEIIAALIECDSKEFKQLKRTFSIAREQQRKLDTLNNIQSIIAWTINNQSAIPSWHGELEIHTLQNIQKKLIHSMNSLPTALFNEEHFPTQEFFKRDYIENGTVTLIDTELSSKGKGHALLLTLGILRKLAESLDHQLPPLVFEESRPLVLIITEDCLSCACPPEMMLGILRLLKLKNIAVYFCFRSLIDVDLSLLDLCRTQLHSSELNLKEPRSQLQPLDPEESAIFRTKASNGSTLQVTREDEKESAESEPHSSFLGSFSKMWQNFIPRIK